MDARSRLGLFGVCLIAGAVGWTSGCSGDDDSTEAAPGQGGAAGSDASSTGGTAGSDAASDTSGSAGKGGSSNTGGSAGKGGSVADAWVDAPNTTDAETWCGNTAEIRAGSKATMEAQEATHVLHRDTLSSCCRIQVGLGETVAWACENPPNDADILAECQQALSAVAAATNEEVRAHILGGTLGSICHPDSAVLSACASSCGATSLCELACDTQARAAQTCDTVSTEFLATGSTSASALQLLQTELPILVVEYDRLMGLADACIALDTDLKAELGDPSMCPDVTAAMADTMDKIAAIKVSIQRLLNGVGLT